MIIAAFTFSGRAPQEWATFAKSGHSMPKFCGPMCGHELSPRLGFVIVTGIVELKPPGSNPVVFIV